MSKTYPIRFIPEMQQAIRDGRKTETRRTNLKWLKVKKGDRLRVLKSGGLMLVATEDARKERLHNITEDAARAEGVEPLHYFPTGCPHCEAFEELWDSIKGKTPGEAFADNPEVAVLTFAEEPHV